MFMLVLACGGASESVVEPQEQLVKVVTLPPAGTPLPPTAAPTFTPIPTWTPFPTYIQLPTHVPLSTYTPVPTSTPKSTVTAIPTVLSTATAVLIRDSNLTPQPPLPRPPRPGGRPEDKYSCSINQDGYCIFSGIPHETGLKPNTKDVVDRKGVFLFLIHEAVAVNSSGAILEAKGSPAFDGDELIKHSMNVMTDDEKAFHRVMAIMFPIRNALMYDIPYVNQSTWDELVLELKTRGIKDKTFTSGATPRDNYYGRQGIFQLAKNPSGKDIHHDVMKFLEESGLYLLCHVTSDEFGQMLKNTHPEGHDPCKDAGITSKIPF